MPVSTNSYLPIPFRAIIFLALALLLTTPLVMAKDIENLCEQIGNKLGSVSTKDCHRQELTFDGTLSHHQRPLAYKIYPPVKGVTPQGKVLFMGGIHGDEYSAVSIMFKWMDKLNQHHSGLFHWKVIPLLNPDGLLEGRRAQRQNGRGVDLNRNFPTSDWNELAHQYWEKRTWRNERRYPGEFANSEIETQWFVGQIEEFKPDVIIAVHAPHELVDYDGPQEGPQQLGNLRLRRLGIYPGSLGNYGGVDLKIPVVTIELPSAGIMPTDEEISQMWTDLVGWLVNNLPRTTEFAKTEETSEPSASEASKVD